MLIKIKHWNLFFLKKLKLIFFLSLIYDIFKEKILNLTENTQYLFRKLSFKNFGYLLIKLRKVGIFFKNKKSYFSSC